MVPNLVAASTGVAQASACAAAGPAARQLMPNRTAPAVWRISRHGSWEAGLNVGTACHPLLVQPGRENEVLHIA
jgi:hypothetical protein